MPPLATDRQRRLLAIRIARMRGHLARLRKRVPIAQRAAGGLEHAIMSASAAVLAWLPTQALGLREGFWSAITAIAVVQTEFGATRTTARDQFTGAAIGGTIGVGIVLACGQHLWSYVLAVLLSVLACWLINVASAARLAGITATIILLVPHQSSVQRMMLSRVSEVAWGVIVAITVVGIATGLAHSHAARRNHRPAP